MNWKILLRLFVTLGSVLSQEASVLYVAYFEKPITDKRSKYLAGVVNGTSLCTMSQRGGSSRRRNMQQPQVALPRSKHDTPCQDFYHHNLDRKVETLRRIYDDLEDVDVILAIHIEKLLPGTYVSPTLYCIMTHNLLLWRRSGKFFFEHGDFPAALTIPQLNEVRKTSIARALCDSGDDVKKIQPAAFFRRGPWNYPVPSRV